jgi:DsbC/DsbD-like thiol-disulfide interchange protein
MFSRSLLAGVMILGLAGLVVAADKSSADKVKMTVNAAKPNADGTQTVTIDLDIASGWHIYANPVNNEALESVATKVTVSKDKKPLKDVKVEYPKGDLIKDKDAGDYIQYVGKVTLKATVKRTAGDGPLSVLVRIQACDKDTCLPPATIEKSID